MSQLRTTSDSVTEVGLYEGILVKSFGAPPRNGNRLAEKFVVQGSKSQTCTVSVRISTI